MVVIQTMPEHIGIIGVSGVVYWMGGAWITLAWLIDRREALTRRLVKAGAVSLILFVPESFKPEVSYLSHFLGYFFGVISAVIYYHINKEKFLASEVIEQICEDDSYVWGVDYGHEVDQGINDAPNTYVLVPLYPEHDYKKQ